VKKIKVRDPSYLTSELKILIIQDKKDTIIAIPGNSFPVK